MDYESIKADVLKELEALGLPQSEIDRIILDFDDIVTKVSDDPSLMKRLAADLISAAKFRANLKSEVPDTIPDELIVEDIAKQEKAAEFPLKKIISGMQKNVDQYGIEAAKVLGLDYGGTVNKGFKVVPEGNNSPNFQEFVDSGKWEEIESQYYPDRTKANAQNADGTVWFGEGDSPGFNATKREVGNKPWIENPTDVELRQWIIDNNIQTLNVAGNRSYGTEELGQKAMNTIIKAVDPNKLPPQGSSLNAAKFTDDFFDPNVGKITSLPDNHIFVFGSNTAGRHGKGAALDAKNNFGAIQGQGYGLQGQSFGIPTKDGQLNVLDNKQIQKYINNFLEFAKNNPDKTFVFTDIGTGLAGKNVNEISSMLTNVPNNVILSKRFSGGGSLGAAKLNDPNVFETFIEKATTDEKKMIKGLDESGKLDDVGGVKGLITDLVTQYPQTAKVIGRSLGAFLQGAATLIDPIGEAIDLGLKLGGKKPVVGGVNAIKREGFTWALWQASAFGFTQIQDMGNIVNMTLDKVGLLPDWYKDKVDVPQNMEEINAEYAINTEKNRRLANQGYKATSLWWWLDQGIPARLTGLSPIEWAIRKYEYNQFGDITDDEKKFLDIMYGYDTRMEKNKESMFGWWQNEFDTNFTKKYYNEAHINDFRKIEKIGPEFGMEGVEIYNDFKELGLIDE